ncbi:MAG: hypothetical protein WA231_17760, partial [Methylocella sp.]
HNPPISVEVDVGEIRAQRPANAAKNLDGVDSPRSPASMCHNVVVGERHNGEEPSAMQVITIGLDFCNRAYSQRRTRDL